MPILPFRNFGFLLLMLTAGCFQNAAQQAQERSAAEVTPIVATYTPEPLAGAESAAASEQEPEPPTRVPTAALAAAVPARVIPTRDLTVVAVASERARSESVDPLNLTASAIVARASQTAAVPGSVMPAATATQAASATPTVQGDCIHIVQRGDLLWSIAQRYGVSVSAIQQASGRSSEIIHAGNELTIPDCGTTGYRQGDGNGGCVPDGWRFVHTVQPNDNLFRIALQYGVNVDELARYNCIPDASRITVGQQIYIR